MGSSPLSISPALSIDDLNAPVTESSLDGKNVLITGGASGVGADLATTFAERGAHVTVVDIQEERGRAFALQLEQRGLRVQFAKADVNSWEEQVEAFKAAVKFHPDRRLDLVIASAGVFGEPFFRPDQPFSSSLSESPEPPVMKEYAVNAVGIHFTARLALEYFELESSSPAAEPKCLILISSMVAYTDIPMVSAYTASKYAARGLFRSARSIFSQRGHRINLLAPWLLATPMTTEWMDMFKECGMPIGEVSLARQAVMRLAQDSSVNGRSIVIGPRRNIDLCDDVEGNFGGIVAKRYLEEELPGWEQTERKLLKYMGVS
ncbi:uncharacterized protein IWZ02DRAFT_504459 [Phyllosticta citriasiana]|uniref:NAD(P)-binding protein n=1 Tax=Phyllosticta citriasiana TaxID=595635 RepID=A0ABR1KF55_9PEZI